jgi:acetyl-CoA acetyltransferase
MVLGNPLQKCKGVAFVGVGDTDYGKLRREQDQLTEPRNAYSMGVSVARDAIRDANLTPEEIDGVLLVRDIPNYEEFCCKLGIKAPRLVNKLEGAGRQSGAAVQYAAMAIMTGIAETVLIVYSNNGRSVGDTYGGRGGPSNPFDLGRPHGMTSPGAQVGMMFNRYAYEFGIDKDDLSLLAISNHYHGSLNPKAVFRNEITREEYLASRYIAEPLHVHDYCLVNDGAVALIMTSLEKAATLGRPVVELLSSSMRGVNGPFYAKEDFFYNELQAVAKEVYAGAGVDREEVQLLQLYDNFTPTILFALEGLGYCGRGEAIDYLKANGSQVGSSKRPINTSGSHTCESYMQGFNLHAEMVRQLRGECGARQADDCRIAQYVIPAPIITSHILARR